MKADFISHRNKYICKICSNKKILHYGCIDYGRESKNDLHKMLCQVAESLLGVDIDKKLIDKYKSKYKIIYGDVTKELSIKEKFDFIVAGEIIEHVTNFGQMLDKAKNYLKKNGKIIISTPNAYGYRNIFRQFFFNHVVQDTEHVCIFDKETLRQAVERHGYEVDFFSYLYVPADNCLHRFIDNFVCRIKKSFAPNILMIIKIKKR